MARIWARFICLLALVLTPVPGWTHAFLVKSVPARRAVLFSAPTRIQLWFNERLEAKYSFLTVTDSNDKRVDLGDVQVATDNPKQLSVGVGTLPPGTYIIKFRVLSVDGHVANDQFPFTIRESR